MTGGSRSWASIFWRRTSRSPSTLASSARRSSSSTCLWSDLLVEAKTVQPVEPSPQRMIGSGLARAAEAARHTAPEIMFPGATTAFFRLLFQRVFASISLWSLLGFRVRRGVEQVQELLLDRPELGRRLERHVADGKVGHVHFVQDARRPGGEDVDRVAQVDRLGHVVG